MMKTINVTGECDSAFVSVALACVLRHNGQVCIEAHGETAVQQLRSAVSGAQNYLKDYGLALTLQTDKQEAVNTGKMTPAVRLIARTKKASIASTLRHEDSVEPISDGQIAEDFEERQNMLSGENQLLDKLRVHNADHPVLSGGDIDAAWDQADVGEETVGGSVPTPDQDIVELLGEAVGLTYDDDEPLNIERKLERRDQHRWELDPASVGNVDDAEADSDRTELSNEENSNPAR